MARFYYARMRVDGMLWYHTQSRPTTRFYASLPYPVFHNYGLTLALAGHIVDPDTGYASLFGVTRYKKPSELFQSLGVYAYPALARRVVLGEFLMAGMNEAIAVLRGRGRLAYPSFTRVTTLMPGSELASIIIAEDRLPRRFTIRIGAKRAGTLLVRIQEIAPKEIYGALVSHPFNTEDVEGVQGYTVLLPHPAGDIAVYGTAERGWQFHVGVGGSRVERLVVPAVSF